MKWPGFNVFDKCFFTNQKFDQLRQWSLIYTPSLNPNKSCKGSIVNRPTSYANETEKEVFS